MAGKSRDAGRSTTTPGWAWAVAGLCGLLLIPVALESNHLTRAVNPLRVAGPAYHPAELNLAGQAATRAASPSRTALGVTGKARASSRVSIGAGGLGLAGVTATGVTGLGGSSAGPAGPTSGLDFHDPTGAFGAGGVTGSGAPAAGPSLVSLGPLLTDSGPIVRAGVDRKGTTVARAEKTPTSSADVKVRPAAPRPRPWVRHLHRSGPASRVRRRRHPRFFGFYVASAAS
jgi:hypothetical protein